MCSSCAMVKLHLSHSAQLTCVHFTLLLLLLLLPLPEKPN